MTIESGEGKSTGRFPLCLHLTIEVRHEGSVDEVGVAAADAKTVSIIVQDIRLHELYPGTFCRVVSDALRVMLCEIALWWWLL
jgi:hypothetical protein